MTTIADIFDLPEHVHQGDYVRRLSEGVEDAEGTLKDYVVTPQLVRCFEGALRITDSVPRPPVARVVGDGAQLEGRATR